MALPAIKGRILIVKGSGQAVPKPMGTLVSFVGIAANGGGVQADKTLTVQVHERCCLYF